MTDFEEIYDLFMAQIDDYELEQLSYSDLKTVLKPYLLNGLVSMQEVVTDIIDTVDEKNERFTRELTFVEKSIVAKTMRLAWVSEKRNSLDLMRKDIGDRDYRSIQGTGYLRELGEMERQLRKEIRQDVIRHSYSREEFTEGLR